MKNWKSILKNERSKFYCVYSLLWWRSERFNALNVKPINQNDMIEIRGTKEEVIRAVNQINGELTRMLISVNTVICNVRLNDVNPTQLEVIKNIAGEVCIHYDLTMLDLKGKSRLRKISDARQMFFYLARKLTKLSSREIGEFLNRDHSTALYAAKQVEQLISIDEEIRNNYQTLKTKLS